MESGALHNTSLNESETKPIEASMAFSQKDIDAAVEAAKAEWKADLKKQIESARSEGERLAKMTAEEKKDEEQRLEYEKFQAEKAEFERKNLIAEIKNQLNNRGLPQAFAEIISGESAEQSKANIETLAAEWNKAIAAAVDEKISKSAGNPKAGTSKVQYSGIEEAFYKINPNLRH